MNLLDAATDLFRRQSRAVLFGEALLLTVAAGFIDYVTGYEIAFYPVYALPILFMVWFGGRYLAIIISALCALVWWWADSAAGHVYANGWLQLWDVIVRLMFFLVVTFAGLAFKQKRDAIGARMALLERSQRLEHEIISISERERQRIGRDLHDGMCQFLAAIGLTADLLRQNLALESHPRTGAAGEIANLLQDAVERTREVARGLSPVDRDEGGLESALEELATSTARLTGAACDFICPEPVPVRDNIDSIHLFRIAQEAVGNATRHGRARNIIIALEAGEGDLSLRISDDGTGFDATASGSAGGGGGRGGGMGLNIMRYRARMLGGTLEIYPNSPAGTVVSCTLHDGAPTPAAAIANNKDVPVYANAH